MGSVAAAFASAIVAGAATGAFAACASRGSIRPRRWLRERRRAVGATAGAVAVVACASSVALIVAVERTRSPLAATCAGVTALIALATWLLLIEPDDRGYPGETPDEPDWWPDFEREFEAWTRSRRVPAGSRN